VRSFARFNEEEEKRGKISLLRILLDHVDGYVSDLNRLARSLLYGCCKPVEGLAHPSTLDSQTMEHLLTIRSTSRVNFAFSS
jgi:hypothetical protein